MIPGVQVTIVSEGYRQTFQPFKLSPNSSLFITDISPDVTPDTTADGAAGIFGLYLMGDTPTADQVCLLWTRYNYRRPGTLCLQANNNKPEPMFWLCPFQNVQPISLKVTNADDVL